MCLHFLQQTAQFEFVIFLLTSFDHKNYKRILSVDGRYLCDKLAQFKDNNGSENCCLRC